MSSASFPPIVLPGSGSLRAPLPRELSSAARALGSPRKSHASRRVKRILDVVLSLVLLLVLSPLLVLIAILIRRDSSGPVLFRQVRSGRGGRPFVMFKFRSMVADAESRRAALEAQNEMDGPVFKIRNDPRVTPFGRFIRATSIDELPQLFNVLRGDMSLVGPRPALPEEVAVYDAVQRRRLSVTPGLTGAWQVSGRNGVSFERWVRLDLDYIDQWSLWLDIKILLKTPLAVIKKTGC